MRFKFHFSNFVWNCYCELTLRNCFVGFLPLELVTTTIYHMGVALK